MKLCYRGISYDYNPPAVETTQGQVGGQYRGADWRFRNLKKPPVLQPTKNLVYRGVAYQRGGTSTVNPAPTVPATPSVQQQARSLFYNRDRAARSRQQSMLNRTAAEVGLNRQAV
ncbi:MAG: DUF4278 domain-containing protein [Cyanobacteriota bacterium]|nr:DUF4278 domain-containing protein [Cyanobacteriota bacterium]